MLPLRGGSAGGGGCSWSQHVIKHAVGVDFGSRGGMLVPAVGSAGTCFRTGSMGILAITSLFFLAALAKSSSDTLAAPGTPAARDR